MSKLFLNIDKWQLFLINNDIALVELIIWPLSAVRTTLFVTLMNNCANNSTVL